MKDIDNKEIKELLTIIPRSYPSMDIFHLSDDCYNLCTELYSLCNGEGYDYDLALTDEKNIDKLSIKARKFDFKRNRYNQHAKMYDFIFIQIDLEIVDDIDTFFKKLYPISKNSGKVIFITKLSYNIQKLQELLIEKNYVAVNPIANTFKNYYILSAQKMHGWGN